MVYGGGTGYRTCSREDALPTLAEQGSAFPTESLSGLRSLAQEIEHLHILRSGGQLGTLSVFSAFWRIGDAVGGYWRALPLSEKKKRRPDNLSAALCFRRKLWLAPVVELSVHGTARVVV